LKARTGRAVLVAVAGDVDEPQLIERSQIQLYLNAFKSFQPFKTFQSSKESDAMLAINPMSTDIIIENFAWAEKSK